MPELVLHELGKKIRMLRKAKGLSQEKLGFEVELHPTYIGGIERGERNPSVKNLAKIAKALDVNISELFIQ